MRKLGALAAVAAFTGVTLITAATPAQATTLQATCETVPGGYSVGAFAEFTNQGAVQHWHSARWAFGGPGVRNRSNTNIRLRSSPDGSHSVNHKLHFTYDSPDILQPNTNYAITINKSAPAADRVYLKFDTIFDIAGDDPHCEMYTPFV